MSGPIVRFMIKRQASPQSSPYWEEFDLHSRPGMNAIVGLMDIAANPVDRWEIRPPGHLRIQLPRRGLRIVRNADQRKSCNGVLIIDKQAGTAGPLGTSVPLSGHSRPCG
jgi:hypothetical protein